MLYAKLLEGWLQSHRRYPLLTIQLWPDSDRSGLAEAWAGIPATRIVDSVPLLESGIDHWITMEADALTEDDAAMGAARIPAGGRWILVTRRAPRWSFPMDVIPAFRAVYSERLIRQMFDSASVARQAATASDGWIGPLGRLIRLGPEASIPTEAAIDLNEVVADWSAPELQAATELAKAAPVDPEDWRQMVFRDSARLVAFESLLRDRGWLIPDGNKARLPEPLKQALKTLESEERSTWSDRLAQARRRRLGTFEPAGVASEAVPDPAPSYRLRLLGPPKLLRLEAGDEVEVAWRLKRSLSCVAYLATAPEAARTKEAMIDNLWGDQHPEVAKRNFHPTLSEARKTLGSSQAILHRGGRYSLGENLRLTVDLQVFLNHLSAADSADAKEGEQRLEALRAAWATYGGAFLEGWEGPWVAEPRRRFHELYVDLLRRIAELAVRFDDLSLALDALRSVLLADPFDERAHVAVMEQYGRSGRRDLVRRQFVILQDRLKELHVEPSKEAVDAYNRWMA